MNTAVHKIFTAMEVPVFVKIGLIFLVLGITSLSVIVPIAHVVSDVRVRQLEFQEEAALIAAESPVTVMRQPEYDPNGIIAGHPGWFVAYMTTQKRFGFFFVSETHPNVQLMKDLPRCAKLEVRYSPRPLEQTLDHTSYLSFSPIP